MAPQVTGNTPTLPYTGKEFLDSLDDGREVWIYGERVKKITTHPAFQNCARMLLQLGDQGSSRGRGNGETGISLRRIAYSFRVTARLRSRTGRRAGMRAGGNF